MRLGFTFFILNLSILYVTSQKSNYNNYQNQEIVKIIKNDVVISRGCMVTALPSDFQTSIGEDNIKFYKLLYVRNFDFCNVTNLSLSDYEAVMITPSTRCGMIQQKANARALNIKILVYIVQSYVLLPDYSSELSKPPAVSLITVPQFNVKVDHWNNSKIGIYVPGMNKPFTRISELLIFSLVVVTILLTMAIAVGFSNDILYIEESRTTSFSQSRTTSVSQSRTTSANGANKGGQLKYLALILPVFMIAMLLLLYFFFFIMVWVLIIAFYFLSAYCLSMLLMLFVKKFNCGPKLKRPLNKCGFQNIDYRYIGLFLFGLVISTVWIIFRKTDIGLILNNVMGVYVCMSVAISLGITFVVGRNFKILLAIMFIVLVLDAVMVYVPIGDNRPNISRQVPLYGSQNDHLRSKRSNGNSIMESVATAMSGTSQEETPIRFKIPKISFNSSDTTSESCQIVNNQYSLIGFGDLILPGSFIVYMLVFAVFTRSNVVLYFLVTFFGYTVGLALTYVAVILSSKGQPALVFLVPCTIVPCLLMSVARKEFMTLWYSDWLPQRLEDTASEVNLSPEDSM